MIWPDSVSNSGHFDNDFIAIYAEGALLTDKLKMESTIGILGIVISIIIVITIEAICALAPRDRS